MRVARQQSENGFTLLETLIVIVVIGLSAMLMLQKGPLRSQRFELASATATITRVVRSAREIALSSGRPAFVMIDPGNHQLIVTGTSKIPITEGLPRCLNVVADTPKEGERIAVRIDPDGLSPQTALVLMCGPHRAGIQFDPLTGRVSADAIP